MAGHEQGRDVVVVPHTHWDREWYKPYQLFRMQLVELVDQLLDLLEGDPSYAHFQLDGQMAVVDDYLEIRPEARGRIEALATAGRLSMGPWYILPDEFLVSGETLVRDLQLGLRTATAFGGAMDVGYLPDMFGHVAQMPQLLRLAGFGHTVVWRGVPSAVDRSAFWWSAPDGSTVRAEYLLDGYGNGAHLPTDAKDLVAAIDRFCDRFDAFLLDDQPLLWMNGTDHLLPQPWLGRVVAEANGIDDDRHLRVGSLADYLAVAPTDGLSSWTGELRSGARANLLMGVASNRTDVKQAAARVERGLERLAEPLATLHLPADVWPGPFLDVAWREVVRNSAHDSICACSHDDVGLAVLHRFAEAGQIADGITERAIAAAGAAMAEPGTVVLNPSARPRRGVVELRLPGREPVEGTQLLGHRGGEIVSDGITRANAAILVQTALDAMPELASSTAEIDDGGVLDVRLERGDGGGARGVGTPVRDVVLGAAAEDPDAPARLTVVTPEMQKVLAWTGEVPGYGWATWAPTPLDVAPVAAAVDDDGTVHIGNGIAEIDVDPATGTFACNGTTGLGRLVDDGDTGDTYNYNQPGGDVVVDVPDAVTVRVLEHGPLRARVAIDRRYTWPTHAAGDARRGEVAVDTTTTLEVQAGSPLVRVSVSLDNPARDHRLRVWFPLPEAADHSLAECAFAAVSRPTVAEGGPTELPLATYPSRRFVCAGGLTVVHEGLLEYELVELDGDDQAHALALTLLRCTGRISQLPMRYRPLPAGPTTPTLDAQMPGHQELRFAVAVGGAAAGDDDAVAAQAYALADEAFTPLATVRARGGGDRPATGSALEVHGAEVSALRRVGGVVELRLVNTAGTPATATVVGRQGWLVDLRGTPVAPFAERVDLRPYEIVTLHLT